MTRSTKLTAADNDTFLTVVIVLATLSGVLLLIALGSSMYLEIYLEKKRVYGNISDSKYGIQAFVIEFK